MVGLASDVTHRICLTENWLGLMQSVFALQVWTEPTRRLAMPTSESLVAPTVGLLTR